MAVYTEVSLPDALLFLAAYDIGELVALTPVRQGVENSNYILATTAGRFILTLYEKRVRAEDLPFFLGLMSHLAAKGIACPQPVADREGRVLGRLAGRPAALTGFLDGASLNRVTPAEVEQLGRALAQLHRAGADYALRRANGMGPAAWQALAIACGPAANTVAAGLWPQVCNELTFLGDHWPQDLPQGVIHADLFPDNVFFSGGTLCGVIDFYFACNDSLAYDLAVCLNAWCFEPPAAFNITKAQALLRGYQSVRPLTAGELAAVPVLARGACLRFLLTRLYDWLHRDPAALVRPKDPLDYLARLNFHRQAVDLAGYGLAA